jgi:hypothetical protein
MVIAAASSEPLFSRPRPRNAEMADVYLRGLQAVINNSSQHGARLAGAAATLETLPCHRPMEMPGSTRPAEDIEQVADAAWWSEGSPRVNPTRIFLSPIPDAAAYGAMLGAGTANTVHASGGTG